jgi:hypothetical protein
MKIESPNSSERSAVRPSATMIDTIVHDEPDEPPTTAPKTQDDQLRCGKAELKLAGL